MGHVDFLYLSEQDMLNAGVLDANECVNTIEEVFRLLSSSGQGPPHQQDPVPPGRHGPQVPGVGVHRPLCAGQGARLTQRAADHGCHHPRRHPRLQPAVPGRRAQPLVGL